MTEQTSRRANPWNRLWRVATSDALLTIAVLGLVVVLVLFLLIPQKPPTTGDTGPWRAQMVTRFGAAMEPMDAVGLFSLDRSPIFHIALAILAFSLSVRTFERAEALWTGKRIQGEDREWTTSEVESLEATCRKLKQRGYRLRRDDAGEIIQADRWPGAEALSFLAHTGPLLLLLSLWISSVWGWQADNVVAQVGEEAEISSYGTIAVPEDTPETWTDASGVRLYQRGAGPEVALYAVDADGESLNLLLRPDAEPVSEIRLRLTDMQSVPYFAIPEMEWLVRIAPQPGAVLASDMPLIVQVLRLRTGDLVAEAIISDETMVRHEGVELHFRRFPYLILSAVYDPGYWLKLVGLVVAGAGLFGWAIWPVRRLWIRREEDHLLVAGDLTAGLAPEKERVAVTDRLATGLRFLTGVTSLVTAGWAAWSLARGGAIWQGTPVQAGLTGGWLLVTLSYLTIQAIVSRRSGREGEER